MKSNDARPELDQQDEVRLRCKDLAGVVEYDGEGIPIIFRRRCKNQQCCPRIEGYMAVHRWIIWGMVEDSHGVKRGVGEYLTSYLPDRNLSEILR